MSRDLIQAALKDILAEKQDHVAGSIAHQRMERAEAALRSVQLPLSPAMCALIESGQVEDGDADLVEPQGQALLPPEQVEECFPESLRTCSRASCGAITVSAQLLHDFAANVQRASQLALPAGAQDAGAQMHANRPESRAGSENKAVFSLTAVPEADAIRNAALEEAAKIPDRQDEIYPGAKAVAAGIAGAIRALKSYPSPAVAQPVADEREAYEQWVAGKYEDEFDWFDIWQAGASHARATFGQPAEAKPTDCSGDPQCCPQNEGHGCQCSALAAKDKPC